LAIIGDEEDVTALIAAKSEPKRESESAKPENEEGSTTPEATKEEKQQLQRQLYQRESLLSPCLTERHNDRRNSSHLVKQSGR
jgi:hypothetical protein